MFIKYVLEKHVSPILGEQGKHETTTFEKC